MGFFWKKIAQSGPTAAAHPSTPYLPTYQPIRLWMMFEKMDNHQTLVNIPATDRDRQSKSRWSFASYLSLPFIEMLWSSHKFLCLYDPGAKTEVLLLYLEKNLIDCYCIKMKRSNWHFNYFRLVVKVHLHYDENAAFLRFMNLKKF